MQDEREERFAWMNAVRVSVRTGATTVGALMLVYIIDLLVTGLRANARCNVPTGFFLFVALAMVTMWMGAMLAQAAGAVLLSKMVTQGVVMGSLINSIILFIFFLMADHRTCSSVLTNGAALMSLIPFAITVTLYLGDVPPVLRKMFFKGDRSPLHQYSRKKRSGPSMGTFTPASGPGISRRVSDEFAPADPNYMPSSQPPQSDFVPAPQPGTQPLSVNYGEEYQI